MVLALITTGCSRPPPAPALEFVHPVPYGLIKTEGVVIESVQGDFILRSGESFNTPFDQDKAWGTWSTLPVAASYAVCTGCRQVRVTVPGQSNKLYGVLHFARMHRAATGPGTRSYLIQIPQQYVDAARDGRVSVVYETVDIAGGLKQSAWTLWLSDLPIETRMDQFRRKRAGAAN